MKKYNNYQIVWVLVIVVVIMAILKIFFGYRGEETTPLPVYITPTVIPTTATSEAKLLQVDETKYPLWSELPYPGNGFTVEKYTAPKVLLVQLNGATKLSATKDINVWLAGFGDAGKGHKLEFGN